MGDRSSHENVHDYRLQPELHVDLQMKALAEAEVMAKNRMLLMEDRRKVAQRAAIAKKMQRVAQDEGFWAINQAQLGEVSSRVHSNSRVYEGIFVPKALQPKGGGLVSPRGAAPVVQNSRSSITAVQITRLNSRLWVPVAPSMRHGSAAWRSGAASEVMGSAAAEASAGQSVHGVIIEPSGEQMWLERGDQSAKRMVSACECPSC